MNIFKQASQEEGRRLFGMMVLNDDGDLVGMLSMYDILLFISKFPNLEEQDNICYSSLM